MVSSDRRLRIHRDQEIDFLLAADVAVLVGANRVPGGQSGDVRREHVLAGDRHAHLENAAQQHRVRTLRTGTIDRRDLNAHVVDDSLVPHASGGFAGHDIRRGHPNTFLQCTGRTQLPVIYGMQVRKHSIIRRHRRSSRANRPTVAGRNLFWNWENPRFTASVVTIRL